MPTFSRTYRTGSSRRTTSNWNRRNNTGSNWTATPYKPTKFNTCRKEIQARIGSFRTLNQQFSGVTNVTAFSPNTANKWIKLVDAGARVFAFNQNQFSRYFGSGWNQSSPTAAFKFLRRKFGTGIKAVTRGRGNTWLIAASPKLSARPFNNYNWK